MAEAEVWLCLITPQIIWALRLRTACGCSAAWRSWLVLYNSAEHLGNEAHKIFVTTNAKMLCASCQVFRGMAEAAMQRAHALSWGLAQLCAAALTLAALRRRAAGRQAVACAALASHRRGGIPAPWSLPSSRALSEAGCAFEHESCISAGAACRPQPSGSQSS